MDPENGGIPPIGGGIGALIMLDYTLRQAINGRSLVSDYPEDRVGEKGRGW